MNNEKVVEDFNEFDDEGISKLPFLEKRLGEIAEILENLRNLQRNEPYKKLCALLWNNRLNVLTRQMRQEAEPIKLYRLQGAIGELEAFVNLELMTQLYNQEFDNLKGQIKQENAKKENS